jgi:hypothetical protein
MDSLGTLGPAVLSLAGVALGAGGSLFGQYLVSRANARQLEAQDSAAHRAELKEVILRFLSLAFQVEKAGAGNTTPAAAPLDQLVDDLWLVQAEIDLAARSELLRGATYRYARGLSGPVRGESFEHEALHEAQVRLMDAAYSELWPSQPRQAGDALHDAPAEAVPEPP